MSGSTSVYRAYGCGWRLLYVGCSGNVKQRMAAHRSQSRWYDQMVHVRVRVYPTREQALAVEARAIKLLKPEFNNPAGKREAMMKRWIEEAKQTMREFNAEFKKEPPNV